MNKRLAGLRQKRANLLAEADALTDKDIAGKLSADEKARLIALVGDDGKSGELADVKAAITREENLDDERRTAGLDAEGEAAETPANATAAALAGAGNGTVARPATVPAQVKKAPEKFKSFGEQLRAVAFAGQKHIGPADWDNRLAGLYQPGRGYEAAASGMNESVPAEGGFLVQNDFAAPILESLFEQGTLISRVRRIPISANSNGLVIPALDESSRADGSRYGGVRGYWANEAATVTASKPKLRDITLKLNKLFGLAYATDELLADSTALGALLDRAFREELQFKAEDAILNGTGAGQPLGIFNSGAYISVAKESGQANDTVVTANVLKMFARLAPRSRANAAWVINQDVLPQLFQLVLGSGTAVISLYRPPGTDTPNAGPLGTLLGRPVFEVEQAATLGDLGDISLLDLSQYMMIDKGGIDAQASMHVRFLYDEMTFRFIFRLDGQPLWRTAVTPKNGSNTVSPFIGLAAR